MSRGIISGLLFGIGMWAIGAYTGYTLCKTQQLRYVRSAKSRLTVKVPTANEGNYQLKFDPPELDSVVREGGYTSYTTDASDIIDLEVRTANEFRKFRATKSACFYGVGSQEDELQLIWSSD